MSRQDAVSRDCDRTNLVGRQALIRRVKRADDLVAAARRIRRGVAMRSARANASDDSECQRRDRWPKSESKSCASHE